jgi:hypothetical protein
MEVIFFPFTLLTGAHLAACQMLFDQTVVYRPSQGLDTSEASGEAPPAGVTFRLPLPYDPEQVREVIADYKAWAALHQKSGLAMLKAQSSQMPFLDDTATSQIRDQIRRGQRGDASASADAQRRLNAVVFLAMAEEFDHQQLSLNASLTSQSAMEKELLEGLVGDGAIPRELSAWSPSQPGEYMIAERLRAWSLLRLNDPSESMLQVTTRRGVIEHIAEHADALQPVFRIDFPLGGQEDLQRQQERRAMLVKALEKLQATDAADPTPFEPPPLETHGANSGRFVCYRLPTLTVSGLCRVLSGAPPQKIADRPSPGPSSAALIGHIDCEPLR